MTAMRRQSLYSLLVVFLFLFFAIALSLSAHARNMMGPGAYYDQQLDVIVRGDPGGQQIYNPNKDVWENYDTNLQRQKSLQEFQLNRQSGNKARDLLSQLQREQRTWGQPIQSGVQYDAQGRRDSEQYNANWRARHGLEPLPDQTQIPAPTMPLDPYARRGSRNGVTCIDPDSGLAYICQR
ncbi:MAG: hypothetical protein WAO98_09125 [Alphaproteobacteria bacterium]